MNTDNKKIKTEQSENKINLYNYFYTAHGVYVIDSKLNLSLQFVAQKKLNMLFYFGILWHPKVHQVWE